MAVKKTGTIMGHLPRDEVQWPKLRY